MRRAREQGRAIGEIARWLILTDSAARAYGVTT